jgi:hypothetical protein
MLFIRAMSKQLECYIHFIVRIDPMDWIIKMLELQLAELLST